MSFHISHWVPWAFLAGVTHSPAKGTLAADLVDLGLELQSYAEAEASARDAIKADLLARARRLVRRAKTEK